jgi:hypothetical protein
VPRLQTIAEYRDLIPLCKALTEVSHKGSLSENQEDKLVPLRMLQGVLYTTRHESLTNLLSKYE